MFGGEAVPRPSRHLRVPNPTCSVRVTDRQRLYNEHIQRGSGDPVLAQCVANRVVVTDNAVRAALKANAVGLSVHYAISQGWTVIDERARDAHCRLSPASRF